MRKFFWVFVLFCSISFCCAGCRKTPVHKKNVEEKKIDQIAETEKNLETIKEIERKEKELLELEKGVVH